MKLKTTWHFTKLNGLNIINVIQYFQDVIKICAALRICFNPSRCVHFQKLYENKNWSYFLFCYNFLKCTGREGLIIHALTSLVKLKTTWHFTKSNGLSIINVIQYFQDVIKICATLRICFNILKCGLNWRRFWVKRNQFWIFFIWSSKIWSCSWL